jgi:hypothetical protein
LGAGPAQASSSGFLAPPVEASVKDAGNTTAEIAKNIATPILFMRLP